MVDGATELLHEIEGERQPGRRAAHIPEIEAHLERKLDLDRLCRKDADDRA